MIRQIKTIFTERNAKKGTPESKARSTIKQQTEEN